MFLIAWLIGFAVKLINSFSPTTYLPTIDMVLLLVICTAAADLKNAAVGIHFLVGHS